jgi:hypothetical protein
VHSELILTLAVTVRFPIEKQLRDGSLLFDNKKKKAIWSCTYYNNSRKYGKVRATVFQSSRRSVSKQAQALQMNRSSIRRIVKRELNFHLYKLIIVQQLKSTDYHQYSEFALEMLSLFKVE